LVSKDAIKESLFDSLGYGGWDRSKIVSRAADAAISALAKGLDGAVLDNFWSPETAGSMLRGVRPTVEVFCNCPAELAFERFRSRTRHPGHADEENTASLESFRTQARWFPIGRLGPVIEVSTISAVDISTLAHRVETALTDAAK